MGRKRRKFGADFKAQVALAAVKGEETMSGLASRFQIHANLIALWKKQLLENITSIFEGPNRASESSTERDKSELYEQLGRLQMEIAFLKKKSAGLG